MVDRSFDDAPQWYWAADSGRGQDFGEFERADDRFVVACGQRSLWSRVRREIDSKEDCAWDKIGLDSGEPTLADCIRVFLSAREVYGVAFNQLMLEFAQIPSFAKFVKDSPYDLGNSISNPAGKGPLPRPPYDENVEAQLGRRIAATLKLEDDWWR